MPRAMQRCMHVPDLDGNTNHREAEAEGLTYTDHNTQIVVASDMVLRVLVMVTIKQGLTRG